MVEGFFGLFRLWQYGYRNVVALMGWSSSKKQHELLIDLLDINGRLWIMPDGDETGERGAQTILPAIAPHRSVRWARLYDGRQPDDLSLEELKTLLGPPG